MLYLANLSHSPPKCPGTESEDFKQFIGKFAKEHLDKSRVKLLEVYIDQACLTRAVDKDHLCSLVLEADSSGRIEDFLRPFPADVRAIMPWTQKFWRAK